MNDLLDPSHVLPVLAQLAPDENPYRFLESKIAQQQVSGWTTPLTVVLAVCSAAWFISLGSNLYILNTKRHTGFHLFRRQPSRYGTFVVPYVPVIWALLQLFTCTCLQLHIAVLLYNGYSTRPLIYAYSLRNLTEVACLIVGWTNVVNTFSSSLITYAARSETSRSRRASIQLTPIVNAAAAIFPLCAVSLQITLTVLGNIQVLRSFDCIRNILRNLHDLAATWQAGEIIGAADLANLQPAARKLSSHLARLQTYTRAWAATQVAIVLVVVLIACPSSLYLVCELRQQIARHQTRVSTLGYGNAQVNQTRWQSIVSSLLVDYPVHESIAATSPTATSNKPQSPEQRLSLLEAVCKNVIASAIFFCIGAISLIPLSVSVLRMSSQRSRSQSTANKIQVAIVAILTFLFVTVDLVLLLRTRLANNLPENRPPHHQPTPAWTTSTFSFEINRPDRSPVLFEGGHFSLVPISKARAPVV